MFRLLLVISLIFSVLNFQKKLRAEERNCYFPDIPSFSNGRNMPDGRPADLSFADYRTLNPKGATLLLSCAQAMYKKANLSQFNDASRKRLDRTMKTTWHDHDTSATAQKDGYIALGGSSEIGSANDLGTMIIGPDKKLVAIGLLLNNVDRIDDNTPLNHVYSNFVFIYDSSPFTEKKEVTIGEMQSILETINRNIDELYVFGNEYFIGPNFD